MNLDDFWAVVKQVQSPDGDKEELCSRLEAALEAMPQNEYVDFVSHFCRLHEEINSSPLMVNAAWLANEQCLSMDYFAYWLILCGKEGFGEAFANPDSILGLMRKFGEPNLDEAGGVVFARGNAQGLTFEEFETPGPLAMLWSDEEQAAAMPELFAYGSCD